MKWIAMGLLLAFLAGCAGAPSADGKAAEPKKKEKMTEVRKAGMGDASGFME
jgi:uncharacterized membrane protein